ncbi:MAG: hypothetical protein QM539_10200 [Alphaproteobacteria bacterium]|nr:hypothetical protein [Alphaproteobacteria bacterium]
MNQYLKKRWTPLKTFFICCLLVVCMPKIQAQTDTATIIATNKTTYKIGETIIIRGTHLKSLGFRSYPSNDSFRISYLSKVYNPATVDTNYSFEIPNTVKNEIYKINAFNYSDVYLGSQKLIRFFVLPKHLDSLGVVA